MTKLEPITGKYVHLNLHDKRYRVYFEESGNGIPLVCQHTASAESLQWRHLLNDKEVTSRFRVIAVDLPYHGKSLPPENFEWWKQEYKLTKEFFLGFHVEFCNTLNLERPVFMGCSIGGDIALNLALDHPDKFRAIISFGGAESTPGFDMVWWDHPRISGQLRFSDPYGAASPYAPENFRREVGWILGKSATPVLRGDSYYYSMEHNLVGQLHKIDTKRVPVYMLAGEYDFASTPEMSSQTANKIKGAKFIEMVKIGHFAMSEDYERFREYLLPILKEIENI